ncbi:helix-turn-helix transcriptional regulator [Lachnospiraceae bacterium 48-42]|jgi:Predicted transcriptional regulator
MATVDITRIKGLREDSDIKQKELADYLGISQRTYSHYENGTRKLPLDILIALAEYYGCSTDYLLGRTKQKELN